MHARRWPTRCAATSPTRLHRLSVRSEDALMITAHDLEVRAGARLLMEDVSFRVAAGRQGRSRRPQRRRQDDADPDPGRRGAAGRRARCPRPARSATCRRTRAPATPRCSPCTGSSPPAASTRSYVGCARPRHEMASEDPDVRDRAMRQLRAGRRRAARRRRVRRRGRGRGRSRPASTSRTGSSTSRCARCPAASGAASSWPGSCSPAPRRCCSTSPPTTSTPTRSCGCASSSSATRAG